MLKLARWAAWALIAGAACPAGAETIHIQEGPIKSVNPQTGQLVILVNVGDDEVVIAPTTMTIPRSAKCYKDDEKTEIPLGLKDPVFKPGAEVKVVFINKGTVVQSVILLRPSPKK